MEDEGAILLAVLKVLGCFFFKVKFEQTIAHSPIPGPSSFFCADCDITGVNFSHVS